MSESKRYYGTLEVRQRGTKTHICAACDFPIAVYGRCAPCLHAYCLTCAASMAQCIICKCLITKLERIPAEAGLFISPLTLQGFRSEADLARHAQQMEAQLSHLMGGGGGGGGAAMGGLPRQPQQQQQQQKQQLQFGWKPPPPPLPPGMGPGTRVGAVMRPH